MVLTVSGSRKAKAVPLIMGDTVEKADIEICKHPSGKGDWLLGTGASGKVVPNLHTYPCALQSVYHTDCMTSMCCVYILPCDVCFMYTLAIAVFKCLHHLVDGLETASQLASCGTKHVCLSCCQPQGHNQQRTVKM